MFGQLLSRPASAAARTYHPGSPQPPTCPPPLQLRHQRRQAEAEAEARELSHLAELEAAQEGVLEVRGGARRMTGASMRLAS